MNWRVVFIFSFLLLIGSFLYKGQNQNSSEHQPLEKTKDDKLETKKEISTPLSKNKQEATQKNRSLKVTTSFKLKDQASQAKIEDKIPAFQLPINDPKHFALADNEGSLYPTNLGVDEDFVIAYGDLIVANASSLEDIKNGDETVKVPKPLPWPKGELPYRMDNDLTDEQKESIVKIAEVLEGERVIKMRPYEPRKDRAYVHFKKGSNHCYAQVGYNGGVTQVALNERCGYPEIFHEVFHVLGFFHEQNRYDRDDFVKILWENIDETHWPQFEKFPVESLPDAFQNPSLTPFSFNTFMLYRSNAFSNNSDYSIVNIYGEAYRENIYPTQEDFRRARILYGVE